MSSPLIFPLDSTYSILERTLNMSNFQTVVSAAAFLACFFGFLYLVYLDTNLYLDYPTATTTEMRPEEELAFPAFSICDYHFRFRQIAEDLGLPRRPFDPKPFREVEHRTSIVYKILFAYSGNISFFLWGYYFDLDEVVSRCSIGGVKCEPDGNSINKSLINPDETKVTFVPAGKWISRFFADSLYGFNYFCHTLEPNLTVDLSQPDGGNAFKLELGYNYRELSPHRRFLVHDKREMLLLRSYRISTLLELTLFSHAVSKTRARLEPRKNVLVQTRHHPCNESEEYSENRCNVAFAWKQRMAKMREKLGADNFTCVLPGLIVNEEDKLPVCDHDEATMENPSKGIIDLVTPNRREISMTTPAIGSELPSNCLKRCDSYDYKLVPEETDDTDADLFGADAYVYFASNEVETWTKAESFSFLTLIFNVGGVMGLLLGASVFTVFGAFIHAFDRYVLKRLKRKSNT